MKRISVKRAAEIMGISPRLLAKNIVYGKMPEIGFAIPSKKYYSFTIFEEDVIRYKVEKEQ